MDMPKVRPRDMAAGLAKVIETHTLIRNGIRQRAEAEAEFRERRDAELNAQARLDGKAGK